MRNSLSDFSQVNLGKKENCAAEQCENFKNMTQAQANEMLFEEVRKQKQNGTFDYQNLQKQVNSLKSFLPEKDFANLQKLLESLK